MIGCPAPLAPLPEQIETPRLLLRCWQPADAARLKDAIDASLAELQAWMPWAQHEPSPIAVLEDRLARFRDDFLAGRNWIFAIVDHTDTRVLGGAGLHPRVGQDALEIGYWIRTAATHCGYATEAAAALTTVAFEFAPIVGVEIRCDPRNVRSAAIPRRLAYRHSATRLGDATTVGGEPRDTAVWTLSRADYAARVAAERWPDG